MSPGRNDPCPCGSGRKYKRCCHAADAARAASEENAGVRPLRRGGHGLPREMRAAAARESTWAADVVPVMVATEVDDGRPVLVLVTAGELIVHSDVRQRVGGEPADVAGALERAVSAAASAVGLAPAALLVRHESVAEALRPLLAARDIAVASGDTPELEAVARSGLEHLTGVGWWPPACRTGTWGAWALPPTLVRDVFAAAARFHRLAPWRSLGNLQAPRAVMPSGREWTCCVLGNAGEEYGLALYSDADDLFATVPLDPEEDPFGNVRGRIISVTFEPMSDAGATATGEARRHRWEVAGPGAWPSLMTVNSPGGGASRADVEDLIALLRAVPAFVESHGRQLEREERTGEPVDAIEWMDPKGGIVLRYAGEAVLYDADEALLNGAEDVAGPDIMPAELRDELHRVFREVSEELGDDADEAAFREAVQARLEQSMVTHNERPQRELGGLSPDQVRRLLESDWDDPDGVVRLPEDLTLDRLGHSGILANARTLLRLAIEHDGLGATQKGNLKLDVVAALIERWQTEDAMFRFLRERRTRLTERDVWPVHELRVVCGLAGLLRKRKQRFEVSRRGRDLAAPDRAGTLYALLFRTWFRKFNLAYGSITEWPALQRQAAFTLYRLPRVADDWRTAPDLLPEVALPYALAHAPLADGVIRDLSASLLAGHVLDPLVEFGLIERHSPGRFPSSTEDRYRVTPLATRFPEYHI